jgi:hypothetical protein
MEGKQAISSSQNFLLFDGNIYFISNFVTVLGHCAAVVASVKTKIHVSDSVRC